MESWNSKFLTAAKNDDIKTVEDCLNHGTEVNCTDSKGRTALHIAAFKGHTKITGLLLSHGASFNSQDKYGMTPLHRAAYKGETEIIGILFTHGACVNSQDIFGGTPLHYAIEHGFKEISDLLITCGADFSLKDNKGRTPYELKQETDTKLSKLIKESIHVGLIDRQSEGIFTDLLKEDSYEHLELRSMLHGEQGTGKSTIARFLVGKGPTKSRKSTNGIELYTGLSFFDDDTEEWIGGKQGFEMEDITVSRSVKSFQNQSTQFKQLQQTNTEPSLQNQIQSFLSNNISDEIFEEQPLVTLSTEGADKVTLEQQGLTNQSLQKTEMYESKEVKSLLPVDNHTESFEAEVDLTLQEVMVKSMLPDEECISKQPGRKDHSMDEQVPTNIDQIAETESPIKPKDNTYFEIIKKPGIIGKLKAIFRVTKKVEEVKISVTKREFFNRSRDVSQTEFHKRKLVPVTIWDFGGQDVFYSTHQTFLTYRAVYMLVLDGSRKLNEPCRYQLFLPGKDGAKTQKDYLSFWINTIITYCKGDIPGFPKIMIILTHKDKLNVADVDVRRNEIFTEIERMFRGSPIEHHLAIEDRIFVNAQKSDDPEMEQIKKSLIYQARIQPTWGQKLPKCFLPLELEIQYLVKKGVTLIHIELLKNINSQQPIRPLTESELKVFLKFQHSVGKILYFDEPYLDQHIIISPTYLIDAFKSIITDKQFCKGSKRKKAWHLMEKKGIILKVAVEKIWKKKKYEHFFKSMRYLLGVMTHLDILVNPLRYDLSHHRKPTEFYYVASMIRKHDTTGYLQSPTFSQRNIAICFVASSLIIPPALSFRFISYCLSIWGVRTYGEDNEDMLFHRSAVFTIDPSLDAHIQCEDEKLIVRLVHAKNRTLIMKDLASSIRECLISALHKISQLYIKTSSETENMRSFNVKVCCSSATEPCSIEIQDIGDVWICPGHQVEHGKDLVLSWFIEKGKEICESLCPVTDEQFLLQTPTDLHLRRLAVQYDINEVSKIVIQLNFAISTWNELCRSTLAEETIKFTALQKCFKLTSFTFKDFKIASEKQGIQSPHTICKVLRDKHISFDREPEKWDLPTTDEDIDKLAPVVGGSSLAFLVELGLTFQDWEQIEYSQTERDLVKLNRKIMEAWKTNCKAHNIKPTLRIIGQAFGNIGINTKIIENILFI